jgi:hypothetical protein
MLALKQSEPCEKYPQESESLFAHGPRKRSISTRCFPEGTRNELFLVRLPLGDKLTWVSLWRLKALSPAVRWLTYRRRFFCLVVSHSLQLMRSARLCYRFDSVLSAT